MAVGRRPQPSHHTGLSTSHLTGSSTHSSRPPSGGKECQQMCGHILQSTTVSNLGWSFHQLFPPLLTPVQLGSQPLSRCAGRSHIIHESEFQKQTWLLSQKWPHRSRRGTGKSGVLLGVGAGPAWGARGIGTTVPQMSNSPGHVVTAFLQGASERPPCFQRPRLLSQDKDY